jgi:Rrf2 family iron-sulfur cluster assembly transcriptional regulator
MFSKTCEYGIKATIFVAKQSLEGERAHLKLIAEAIASPEAFTAKILQQLVKRKVIYSTKGANGGFWMEPQKLETMRLREVVAAMGCDGMLHACVLGLAECSDSNPCPIHTKYCDLKRHIVKLLDNTTVFELVHGVNFSLGVLKI